MSEEIVVSTTEEQPVATETAAEETQTSETTERVDNETSESDPEQPRDENGRFKPKDDLPEGVQKRINKEIAKAVAARKQAEEYAAEIRRKLDEQGSRPDQKAAEPAKPAVKPQLADFESIESYTEAMADWRYEQREAAKAKEAEDRAAKQRAREAEETWKQRREAAKQILKVDDYDDLIESANIPDGPGKVAIFQNLVDSEIGGVIAYHLATHPEETERLAKLSPAAATREIGKLEDKLSKPATPQSPKVSKAPPPITPVGQRAASSQRLDDEKLSFREWEALRNAQIASRR